MKNKKYCSIISSLCLVILSTISFAPFKDTEPPTVKVMIVTDLGTMKIKLYNETPLHRDNFVKLIKAHYYDSLTFHRIIQNFVIEGGDPNSKKADSTLKLGDGGPGYTLPAEINQKLFHKKGALAAIRKSDFENPDKVSSGSQFYIVQGAIHREDMLNLPAKRIDKMKLFNEIIRRPENKNLYLKYQAFSRTEELDSLKEVNAIILKQVELELPKIKPYTYTAEQIKAYTTIGGAPHLDNGYTVFGEVYEGLSIIDEIAKQPVDRNGKPLTGIRMKVSIIK